MASNLQYTQVNPNAPEAPDRQWKYNVRRTRCENLRAFRVEVKDLGRDIDDYRREGAQLSTVCNGLLLMDQQHKAGSGAAQKSSKNNLLQVTDKNKSSTGALKAKLLGRVDNHKELANAMSKHSRKHMEHSVSSLSFLQSHMEQSKDCVDVVMRAHGAKNVEPLRKSTTAAVAQSSKVSKAEQTMSKMSTKKHSATPTPSSSSKTHHHHHADSVSNLQQQHTEEHTEMQQHTEKHQDTKHQDSTTLAIPPSKPSVTSTNWWSFPNVDGIPTFDDMGITAFVQMGKSSSTSMQSSMSTTQMEAKSYDHCKSHLMSTCPALLQEFSEAIAAKESTVETAKTSLINTEEFCKDNKVNENMEAEELQEFAMHGETQYGIQ